MEPAAFQDFYPDDAGRCYGCGRLNEQGHRIRTVWDGEETLTRFTPKPFHTAVPGVVYGGLLASLVDCHGTGSAAGGGGPRPGGGARRPARAGGRGPPPHGGGRGGSGGRRAARVHGPGPGPPAGAGSRAEGREPGTEPALRYVTASLRVEYLKPTPLGPELEIRGRIVEVKDRGEERARKVVVEVRVLCAGVETVRGEVVAVKMPAGMGKG